MQSLDAFAQIAADTAMRAAAEYIRVHGLKVLDYDAATACLKTYVKTRLLQALLDAREAFEAGMGAVAQQTFLASMRLAGIEAAKEFAWPMDYVPA